MESAAALPTGTLTGLKYGVDRSGASAIQRWRAACSETSAMGHPAAKKARGGADGLVPTIREFLPWHVIEKKMAARAERRNVPEDDDESPGSGVYTSGEHSGAANENEQPSGDSGGLTYKVYTLAELEARGINADISVNSTRMSMVMMAPKPTPWADTLRAAVVVARIAKTWVTASSPRPAAKDVFRTPIVALTYELRQATKTIEWKKIGAYAGASVFVFLFLLFAVVTAADLTDDLKPSRSMNTQSGDAVTSSIVASAQPAVAPPPAPASTGDGLEVSAESTPAPPPAPVAKSSPKRKGYAKAKKKNGEVFSP